MKTLILWAALFAAVASLFGQFGNEPVRGTIPYSEFMRRAEAGDFKHVLVEGSKIRALAQDNSVAVVNAPQDVFMIPDLRKAGVEIDAEPPDERSLLTTIFISWFPMLLLIGVWGFLYAANARRRTRRGVFVRQKPRANDLRKRQRRHL